ncbi:hypothetical protein K461DRAFT_281616 [Myriangium duriaei CBS 260.36]|uniref:Zn(2)-C6 fungal-type domain-containing protein n=1 Tax=Myriangium duriaei CBS 260.36 TaxID=1168546 RepID=A0A9P4IV01_9PEZI|nr:hypothetical protein K461DRAFT_281616 [Myriangium duriaei CBS 260.36]
MWDTGTQPPCDLQETIPRSVIDLPPANGVPSRSNTACWTCRLRRKKCDEEHPACRNCITLDVPCHGYGQKPSWKDGGEKEAEVTQRIKRMVKTNLQRRRREQFRRSRHSPDPSVQSTATGSKSNSPLLSPFRDLGSNDLSLDHSFLLDIGNFEVPAIDDELDISAYFSSPTRTENTISAPFIPPQSKIPPLAPLDISASPFHHLHRLSGSTSLPTPDFTPFAPLPTETQSSSRSHIESLLLGYYFDCVFDEYFPFYKSSSSSNNRSWLLSLICHNGPAYHATLALCATYQYSVSREDAIPNYTKEVALKDAQLYHTTALKGLREQLDSFVSGQKSAVTYPEECARALLSILQLVFASILRSEHQAWKLHFEAASRLFAANSISPNDPLTTHPATTTDTTLPCSQLMPDFICDQSFDFGGLSALDERPLQFLLGNFIRLDALSCATFRTRATLTIPLTSILSAHDISPLTGCLNATISALLRISALDTWRSDEERAGRLSLPKLVQRASAIESDLNALLDSRADSVVGSPKTTPPATGLPALIAPVYISAALVYLHVVVSGPHPHLPEIKTSVKATLERLRALPVRARAERVAWPICVAGCMATGEEAGAFNGELVAPAEGRVGASTRVALQVVKECWRIREGTGSCEWSKAMGSLGVGLPLI